MTVSSTTNRKSFTGDGSTTAFGTSPVVFFDESELEVYLVTTATGASTLQTITTHYTVSGGAGTTGTVTMVTAPASTETLVILRVLPYTQTDDYVNNDINDAEVLEDRLDKLTMLTQQLDEVDERSLKLSSAETGAAALTELPFDRASKFLAFDASKNPIASAGTTETPVSAFMATVLDDTTAADARTTLGASATEPDDATFKIVGSADATKKARFEVDGLTTVTTRVYTLQDSDDTLVGRATTDTLTNKTLTSPVINTAVTGTAIATQSQQETGTAVDVLVTPGRQHFHQSAIKSYTCFNGTGTPALIANYGAAGLIDNGAGDYTVTYAGFSAATTMSAIASCSNEDAGDYFATCPFGSGFTTTAVRVAAFSGGRVKTDVANINVWVAGDL
jgi:hypothetical protein